MYYTYIWSTVMRRLARQKTHARASTRAVLCVSNAYINTLLHSPPHLLPHLCADWGMPPNTARVRVF